VLFRTSFRTQPVQNVIFSVQLTFQKVARYRGKWTENEKKRSFIFLSLFDLKLGHSADNFFFQKEIKFFYFTTLIQLPMAHIKITFLKKNLTRWLSYLPQMGLKWVKKHLLGHISSFYYCHLENIFLVPPWVIVNIFYYWCKKKKKKSKMTFGFCRWPRENDVWNENYKWPHLAPDFSKDLVKLGPKLT
jgi:hypothetical protein